MKSQCVSSCIAAIAGFGMVSQKLTCWCWRRLSATPPPRPPGPDPSTAGSENGDGLCMRKQTFMDKSIIITFLFGTFTRLWKFNLILRIYLNTLQIVPVLTQYFSVSLQSLSTWWRSRGTASTVRQSPIISCSWWGWWKSTTLTLPWHWSVM